MRFYLDGPPGVGKTTLLRRYFPQVVVPSLTSLVGHDHLPGDSFDEGEACSFLDWYLDAELSRADSSGLFDGSALHHLAYAETFGTRFDLSALARLALEWRRRVPRPEAVFIAITRDPSIGLARLDIRTPPQTRRLGWFWYDQTFRERYTEVLCVTARAVCRTPPILVDLGDAGAWRSLKEAMERFGEGSLSLAPASPEMGELDGKRLNA